MEVAGRAGGLIPTNRIALRDVVLHGDRDASVLAGAALERDPSVVAELLDGSVAARRRRVRHRLELRASTDRSSRWRCRPSNAATR